MMNDKISKTIKYISLKLPNKPQRKSLPSSLSQRQQNYQMVLSFLQGLLIKVQQQIQYNQGCIEFVKHFSFIVNRFNNFYFTDQNQAYAQLDIVAEDEPICEMNHQIKMIKKQAKDPNQQLLMCQQLNARCLKPNISKQNINRKIQSISKIKIKSQSCNIEDSNLRIIDKLKKQHQQIKSNSNYQLIKIIQQNENNKENAKHNQLRLVLARKKQLSIQTQKFTKHQAQGYLPTLRKKIQSSPFYHNEDGKMIKIEKRQHNYSAIEEPMMTLSHVKITSNTIVNGTSSLKKKPIIELKKKKKRLGMSDTCQIIEQMNQEQDDYSSKIKKEFQENKNIRLTCLQDSKQKQKRLKLPNIY